MARKPTRDPKKSPLALPLACLVAAVVVAVFFAWRSGRKHRGVPAAKVESAQVAAPAAPKPAAKAAAAPDAAAAAAAPKVLESEQRAEIRSLPLPPAGDGFELVVDVRAMSQCGTGDLDFMAIETLGRADTPFLISIEPLAPAADWPEELLTRPFKVAEIQAGQKLRFLVPRALAQIPMGLFVCRDKRRDGHCRGKAVETPAQIYASHVKAMQAERLENIDLPDRIYAFEFIQVNEGVLKTAPDRGLSDADYRRMGQFMSASAGRGVDARAAQNEFRRLNSTLGSLPMKLATKSIEVSLPKRDDASCLGGTPVASPSGAPPTDVAATSERADGRPGRPPFSKWVQPPPPRGPNGELLPLPGPPDSGPVVPTLQGSSQKP